MKVAIKKLPENPRSDIYKLKFSEVVSFMVKENSDGLEFIVSMANSPHINIEMVEEYPLYQEGDRVMWAE